MICSRDNCHREAAKRGLCGACYKRLRLRGELPSTWNAPPRVNRGLDFLRSSLSTKSDECIEWPFGLTGVGYGLVNFEGRRQGAHRVMCVLANGAPPQEGLDAAHSCGNRGCVNPRHLRWATRRENYADCLLHGTVPVGNGSKLTPKDVRQIYDDPRSHTVIAKEFGCSSTAILYIQSGRTWRSITGAARS